MEQGGQAQHVAQHSWAPVIMGTGVFVLNAGFVFGLAVGVVGVLIFAAGTAVWIAEDIGIYERGSDDGEHH